LGQSDMPLDAALYAAPSLCFGISTHNEHEFTAAARIAAVQPRVAYVALGPIYPTRSKERPEACVGAAALQGLRTCFPNIDLVAIGGIDAGNIESVSPYATSVALIGALVAAVEGESQQGAMQRQLAIVWSELCGAAALANARPPGALS
jgi:thiamine-phosphate diphosphorylase